MLRFQHAGSFGAGAGVVAGGVQV
jgi:hypothetical protein